jgi:hypothetical protein
VEETTMPVNVTRTLQQALHQIQAERDRLDRQLRTIRAALGGDGRSAVRRHRRPMSAAARRAVSQRMKAYWAARRAKRSKKG